MKKTYKIVVSLIAVTLLIALVTVSFSAFNQMEEAGAGRKHSFGVIKKAGELLSELTDAETGQRGYVLTGNEAFLEPYLAVRDGVRGHLEELRQLTLMSESRKHLDTMVPLLDAKMLELARVIELRRNQGLTAAQAAISSGQGKRLMDSIRTEMNGFIQIEEDVWAQHDAVFQMNLHRLFYSIVAVSVFILLLALLITYLISREAKHRILQTTKLLENTALEYAESIINTVREPLIALDQDLRVVKVSRSFYEFFKVKPEDTVGQLIYDLGNRQWDIPKLRELLETILPQMATFDNYEVEHVFADIGRRTMLLNARQIQRVSGKERVILLAIEDITEKKILEREAVNAREVAEAATRSKSEFLANMSHELRTPLNSIIGFSEVLEDQMFGQLNEKQQRYVNNVLSSARHLLSLINDVLDLSKVEAGKMDLELKKIHLKTTLEYAMDMQKEKALKHNIDFALKLMPEADVDMMVDERKFKQVMFNLLSNALKFTPDGGGVTVGVIKVNSEVEIRVEDTGLGIKADDIPKLFTAFTQLESGSTKTHEGTGLGLVLTKKLVEMHGGRIWVESAGEGKGSLFIFTLPIKEV